MNRLALPFAVTFTALVALTGCTSGSSDVETPTATVTDTATVTATPSATASATPSAPAGVDGEDGGTGGPDTAGGACRTADLAGSTADDGGGAAGSVEIAIVLTNTGTTSCTLQGWPGVSFVGGGDGTQIGASAKQDAASPHETVTLDPGRRGAGIPARHPGAGLLQRRVRAARRRRLPGLPARRDGVALRREPAGGLLERIGRAADRGRPAGRLTGPAAG